MTWLIDTNVISEIRRGTRCHPAVAAWWGSVVEQDLFLSVLTLGEIRRGIEQLRPRDAGRAGLLDAWLAELAEAFGPRILAVDATAAAEWGRLSAGRTVPVIDALLAATARLHGLVLVTRNAADLDGLDVRLLNPFEPASGKDPA